jgi:arabinose-5-phosphate isomerase
MEFVAAVRTMKAATGRIILSGMGKSGQIARKIASTLASTGTPAMFVHPSDASHGDLGMITQSDAIIVLSWSGETEELRNIVAYSRRFAVPLIAITAAAGSALAKSADIVLELPICAEACPNGLAPTTSTTVQLVLGDALAVALLEDRGFTAIDFRRLHPGGRLGAALTFVRDIMHAGDQVPLAVETMAMSEAVVVMTEKSFGCLGIVDSAGELAGIITDGDLRRHMTPDLLSLKAGAVMTRNPVVASPDDLASSVLDRLNRSSITSLFVVQDRKPVGIIHIHDLLRLGVA